MTFDKVRLSLKWLFSRVGVFYLLIALVSLCFVDFQAADGRIKIRRLNDARPDMSALVSFAKGDIPADKVNWKPYLKYFSLVVNYMPGEEVTRMFLGISRYYAGDPHKTSWGYIQRAAEAYPFIFWSLYNAGVFAFERGNMELAVRYLERALVLPVDRAGIAIQASVAYRQVMAAPNFTVQVMDDVKAARANIYLLLAAAGFYTKDYAKAKAIALDALHKPDVKDKEPFYFYAGMASLGLGEVKDALAYITKCVELKSRNPQVYFSAGEIFKMSGQTATAEDLFKTARALEARQPKGFPYPELLRLRFF